MQLINDIKIIIFNTNEMNKFLNEMKNSVGRSTFPLL